MKEDMTGERDETERLKVLQIEIEKEEAHRGAWRGRETLDFGAFSEIGQKGESGPGN